MQMIFSPDGERLLSLGNDGYIHVHDVLQVYLPSKVLALAPAKVQSAAMAMSADGSLLAASVRIAGHTYSSILLYSGVVLLTMPFWAGSCASCTDLFKGKQAYVGMLSRSTKQATTEG